MGRPGPRDRSSRATGSKPWAGAAAWASSTARPTRARPRRRAQGDRAGARRGRAIRERFLASRRVAASIDHPNVIPVYDAGERGRLAYIAMRFVEGGTCARCVARERRARAGPRRADPRPGRGGARRRARAPGSSTATSSPPTSCSAPDEHAYLTDFGLSKHSSRAAADDAHGPVGRHPRLRRAGADPRRADRRPRRVYALGCVLFFVLTGSVPFPRDGDEARLWAHLADPPPAAATAVAGLPRASTRDRPRAREVARRPLPVRWRPRPRGRRAAETAVERSRSGSSRAAPRRRRDPDARLDSPSVPPPPWDVTPTVG